METNFLLKNFSNDDLLKLFELVYDKTSNNSYSSWFYKTKTLLIVALKVEPFLSLESKHERLLKAISFDYLQNLFLNNDVPQDIRSDIINYFLSLSSFNIFTKKQNDTTYEQHGLSAMELISFFGELNVIKKDLILFDDDWVLDKERKNILMSTFNSFFPQDELNNSVFEELYKLRLGKVTQYNILSYYINNPQYDIIKYFIVSILQYGSNPLKNKYINFLDKVKKKNEILTNFYYLSKQISKQNIIIDNEKIIKV